MKQFIKSVLFILLIVWLTASKVYALDAQQVYKKVQKSIYTLYGIHAQKNRPVALGSAVAITKNILATNCHVALAGHYLVLKVGNQYKTARVVYHNRRQDLCLVEVPGMQFTSVPIRQSKKVAIGEDVVAIGNPAGLEKTLSKGIISNIHRARGSVLLQTDASVSRGSSGGGLFDNKGNLIGIITLKLRRADDIALAIPTEWVLSALAHEPNKVDYTKPPTSASAAPSQATRIGTYGRDKIILMKRDNKCVFSAVGYDRANQLQFEALWSPNYRGFMMFFPLNLASQRIIRDSIFGPIKRDQIKMYGRTRNQLRLENKNYAILYYQKLDTTRPALITKIKNKLNPILTKQSHFIVRMYDPHSLNKFTNVRFGLDGLAAAIKSYQQHCK